MQRAQITVVSKDGVRRDASCLSVVMIPGDGGMSTALTFICSGVPVQIASSEVESIEWSPGGAHWCPWCDGPLASFVGTGGAA